MLKGTLALVIRYILLIGGGALASAGIITSSGELGFYCFDAKTVADAAASAIAMTLGGGASVAAGIGWRALVKRLPGGVT